jgi:hypothetical protein
MRLQFRHLLLPGLLLALTMGGAGCSGVSHTHSVSPLDFLLPGAGFLKADPPKPVVDPTLPPPPDAPQVAVVR